NFLAASGRCHYRKSLQIARFGRTRPVFRAISWRPVAAATTENCCKSPDLGGGAWFFAQFPGGQWPLPLPKIAANRPIWADAPGFFLVIKKHRVRPTLPDAMFF
ncbi:MAG: hypothetical protein Q4F18_12210, partial [Clostridia bacterium]|nr:hypothetical protein [Clostridia bacterium]